MTSKKRPNVIKVTGKVNSTIIGFTKKLSNAKTIATVIAVVNSSIVTPFISLAITNTNSDVMSILRINFMMWRN